MKPNTKDMRDGVLSANEIGDSCGVPAPGYRDDFEVHCRLEIVDDPPSEWKLIPYGVKWGYWR